jgi:hypothetical protein
MFAPGDSLKSTQISHPHRLLRQPIAREWHAQMDPLTQTLVVAVQALRARLPFDIRA